MKCHCHFQSLKARELEISESLITASTEDTRSTAIEQLQQRVCREICREAVDKCWFIKSVGSKLECISVIRTTGGARFHEWSNEEVALIGPCSGALIIHPERDVLAANLHCGLAINYIQTVYLFSANRTCSLLVRADWRELLLFQ